VEEPRLSEDGPHGQGDPQKRCLQVSKKKKKKKKRRKEKGEKGGKNEGQGLCNVKQKSLNELYGLVFIGRSTR
jgi:hypothetical protein